jgi:hypothetical protein
MKWDKDKAQAALRQIDATILNGISSLNRNIYQVTGLHPLFLLLCTTLTLLIMAAAIIATSWSEGIEVMSIFLAMFSFFMWPSVKVTLGLRRIVKREWTLSTYKPAMAYHTANLPLWNRRIGVLLRCFAVFSLLFVANLHWPAPDFILYLAAFCLFTPLEIYVRHSEPPIPEDSDKVSSRILPSAV